VTTSPSGDPCCGGAPDIACTLDAAAVGDRAGEWRAVLAHARHRQPLDDGIRIEFDTALDVAELARLAVAEHDCCRFFAFTLTVDGRGPALEVRAPADAAPIVAALFG
jgi:hypothetical protein